MIIHYFYIYVEKSVHINNYSPQVARLTLAKPRTLASSPPKSAPPPAPSSCSRWLEELDNLSTADPVLPGVYPTLTLVRRRPECPTAGFLRLIGLPCATQDLSSHSIWSLDVPVRGRAPARDSVLRSGCQ